MRNRLRRFNHADFHRFLPMETVGLQPTEEIGIARRLCERNPLLQYRVK
jgi:hypothetical protein